METLIPEKNANLTYALLNRLSLQYGTTMQKQSSRSKPAFFIVENYCYETGWGFILSGMPFFKVGKPQFCSNTFVKQ